MSVVEEVSRRLHDEEGSAARSHLDRLPDRYVECFDPADIAEHVQHLAALTPDDPVRLLVSPTEAGLTECTVLAFDHPWLFSLISGVLSSRGLDVAAGDVFTMDPVGGPSPAPARPRIRGLRRRLPLAQPGETRRKIIDRFRGRAIDPLQAARWRETLEADLRSVLALLELDPIHGLHRARARVNDMVAEALATLDVDSSRGLLPVDIAVDNEREGTTLLSVTSEDTPFFLYAFSGALSLRGVSIEYVRIRTEGSRIHDVFGVVDRRGQKVRDAGLLDQIKLSALLTKQFSYFLASSPDPTSAIARFEELVEHAFPAGERERWVRYLSDPRALQDLARLLGASDFLWEDFIRQQYEALLPILAPRVGEPDIAPPRTTVAPRLRAAVEAAPTPEEKVDALNRFKDAEIFAYDLDHILDPSGGHAELSVRLTHLAECVVSAAVELAMAAHASRHGVPRTVAGLAVPYVVAGLGKLGGEALGYASDIELLVVYQDNGMTDGAVALENGAFFGDVARDVAAMIRTKREGIFSVDLRLRPYGSSGQAACSLDTFCRYYARDGDAHAYERLALVGMRALTGDTEFGARLERLRDELLYVSGAIDLAALRTLRIRQAEEKDAIRRSNAKFSPGALVDLEYTVQILQVMYGRQNRALRTPKIRDALAALKDAGVLEPLEAEQLGAAYAFLRGLINALRMLRGSALDLYLPDPGSEEYIHLARRMGYRAGRDPARQLHLDFEAQTAEIRGFMTRHFGSQSLLAGEVGSIADLVISDDVPPKLRARVLEGARFRDTERAYRNLRALAGVGTTRRTFARLAVLAADMLPRKPDADMALNNWERYMARLDDWGAFYERLLAQPTALDILLSILATSQYLSDTLVRHPDFFEWLVEPVAAGRIRDRGEISRDLAAYCGATARPDGDAAELRTFKRREIARIGTKDICLGAGLEEVVFEISELADAVIAHVLEQALNEIGAHRPAMAILAFGKLGGRELNYSSDIDLVGVYDGEAADAPACSAILEKLQRVLGGHTDTGYLYRVDFRLRPYGTSGELAASLRALDTYYRKTASVWELQAALKARAVAGDPKTMEKLTATLHAALHERVGATLAEPGGRERIHVAIRTLRNASARPRGRLSRAVVDVKNGRGGIRDVESVIQAMQLVAFTAHPELLEANTLLAVERARRAGLLPQTEAASLRDAYVFLRKIEHYLQIFEDRQTHTLPTEVWRQEHLARSLLGHTATRADLDVRLAAVRDTVSTALTRYLG